MFERYTEKARRVIFFARYEASHYGSQSIETEHLLLGLLREEKSVHLWVPKAQPEIIRQQIDSALEKRKSILTSVGLPLGQSSKLVLKYAAEEADRLTDKHIGTEHLVLGLIREKNCFAAKLLTKQGANLDKLRKNIEKRKDLPEQSSRSYPVPRGIPVFAESGTIEIHGSPRSAQDVHEAVKRCRQYRWSQRTWTAGDVVIERQSGKASFDLSLAEDPGNFELVKGGWKKDHREICLWELFESQEDASHGTGYTNGRDWLCNGCYDKF